MQKRFKNGSIQTAMIHTQKRFSAAIFDLDGTLLNTLEDLADSCNAALKIMGYPEHSIDDVRKFVGNGLGVLMELALPGGKANHDYEKALETLRRHYAHNWQNKTKPYNGILDLIQALNKKGIKIAIVSNKPDMQVKELSQLYFNGEIPVNAAIGEKESAGIRRKPAPDSVFTAIKEIGAQKETSVYIGDSDVDIMTAQNAGLDCISVTWGFRSKDFLIEHGAKTLINKPEELLDFF